MSASNSQPLVSVLTTVYNRERYLSECIESILKSTYTNFELIIVDDKSTDDSLNIAKGYEKDDSRISVHVNSINLGDYPNRNKAASYAKGKYLKYLDADDTIYENGLENMVSYMEQYPNASLGLFSTQKMAKEMNPAESYKSYYLYSEGHFDRSPLSAIINRECFEREGGFSNKRMVGDFEMWHVLARSYPIVLLPGGFAWYRVHGDQEMTLGRSDILFRLKYLEVSLDQVSHPECPLVEHDRANVISVIKRKKARLVLTALKNNNWQKARELYNASDFNLMEWLRYSFDFTIKI